MKTVAYMSKLMMLAKKAGETRDPDDIRALREYEKFCLHATEFVCTIPKDD